MIDWLNHLNEQFSECRLAIWSKIVSMNWLIVWLVDWLARSFINRSTSGFLPFWAESSAAILSNGGSVDEKFADIPVLRLSKRLHCRKIRHIHHTIHSSSPLAPTKFMNYSLMSLTFHYILNPSFQSAITSDTMRSLCSFFQPRQTTVLEKGNTAKALRI